jgi:hypothetical protein
MNLINILLQGEGNVQAKEIQKINKTIHELYYITCVGGYANRGQL